MSLSWPDRVEVSVSERAVAVRLCPAWRTAERVVEHPYSGGGDACTAALATALSELGAKKFHAHVRLSNSLVRYAIVGQAQSLRGDAERRAAATHALAQSFGDVASRWQVAADRSGLHDAMLCAGVDASLVRGLREVLQAAGASRVHMQPSLALAMDALALRSPRHDGWLACCETERITLVSYQRGEPRSVRSHRVRSGASDELPLLLDQVRLLEGETASQRALVIEGEEAQALAGLPWGDVGIEGASALASTHGAARLRVDFADAAPAVRLRDAAFVAIGVIAIATVAWQYGGLARERAALEASLQEADRFSQRQGPRTIDPQRPESRALMADVARANAVAARLSTPWDALFGDLETASSGIVLTALEPESGMRRMRISGEANRYEDVTGYLARLEATPAFHNVFLTAHEVNDRRVAFTLMADWIRSDEAPRP